MANPSLSKVRIYDDPKDGLTVELDGKKLDGLTNVSYHISSTNPMPTLSLTMVADVSVDSSAKVEISKMVISDPRKDAAEF